MKIELKTSKKAPQTCKGKKLRKKTKGAGSVFRISD
jgi:hypothetical protein